MSCESPLARGPLLEGAAYLGKNEALIPDHTRCSHETGRGIGAAGVGLAGWGCTMMYDVSPGRT